MERQTVTEERIRRFAGILAGEERSAGTIEKYVRDVRKFAAWLDGEEVSRERTAAWRDGLLERGYAPVTVNSMVAAVNRFFIALGWEDCRVKALRIQRGSSGMTAGSSPGRSMSACSPPPTAWAGSGWRCCWRPSAPPASG